jgi:hypothetical protein
MDVPPVLRDNDGCDRDRNQHRQRSRYTHRNKKCQHGHGDKRFAEAD